MLASFKGGLQGRNYLGQLLLRCWRHQPITLQFSQGSRLSSNGCRPPGVLGGKRLNSAFGCRSARLGSRDRFPVSALVHMLGSCDELSFSKELESLVCVVLDVSVVDQTLNEPKISSGYCEVSQWCARSEYSVAELLADILVLLNNHFEVSCESALYMSSSLWGHCREFFWINRNPAFSFTKPLMD